MYIVRLICRLNNLEKTLLKKRRKTTLCIFKEFMADTLPRPSMSSGHNHMVIKTQRAVTAICLLSACATRPESISASYISHEKYIDNDCAKLSSLMNDARAELTKFSDMQNTKANIDAASVFFVLIPASKLTGDSASDVAKWKGEVEAIDTAQIKNKCK